MNSWHYLPVYRERVSRDDVLREYSICEAYLDKKGCLSAWTESSSIPSKFAAVCVSVNAIYADPTNVPSNTASENKR